jgi:hypothetical protein
MGFESAGEGLAGELTALVGIENGRRFASTGASSVPYDYASP